MKKLISLAMFLFFAVAAAAQNYTSQKINQIVVEGKLEQTVFAGENIETIRILYENTGFGENYDPEYKEGSTKLTDNFGLTKRWTKGPICEISGQMRKDIAAGTYNAYIVVKDDEGNLAKTELTFIVEEKPIPSISLELSNRSGEADQNVEAGKSITPIVFDYEGITSYSVSGLPSGLSYNIDEANQKILITGTVDKDIMSGDYEYKVTVENDAGGTASQTGTISVTGGEGKTDIEISENETQKVVAGDAIKPVVFLFKNVRVDENLSSFNTGEGSLKGKFNYSVQDNKLTVSGTVDENLEDGSYSIKIIVEGENNNDTAFASVEVTRKPIVTKITVIKNASQKVTAGDSIKPIVFYKEHALELVLPNFPGGYERMENDDTVTIIGLIQEGSRGLHDIVLSVIGPENQATAKATIEVIPATMTFDLVEGSDNQTVVAGQDIAPIVYQYSHMYSVKGNVPANLKVEQDKEKKQVKISGTIDPESATHEYTYTFELTDYYEQKMTVSGKIKVVASSSSTLVASSSSSIPIEDLSSSSAMSSGSDHSSNIVAAMPSFVFSYANNELTVVSPNSAMVRVQVFDLMGHVVETFTESATSVKNFSLASLTKGNYVVRIESAHAVRLAKITVK